MKGLLVLVTPVGWFMEKWRKRKIHGTSEEKERKKAWIWGGGHGSLTIRTAQGFIGLCL
jgi:hypothetical protein